MSEHRLTRFTWSLSCKVRAPLATTATENAPYGIDQDYLRDEDGRILISGDQVRGLFLHFVAQVRAEERNAEVDEEGQLLGDARIAAFFGRQGLQLSDAAESDYQGEEMLLTDTTRGRLVIRDLALDEVDEPGGEIGSFDRTRIRIDRVRGSVETGSLLVRRQEHPTGEVLSFSSRTTPAGASETVVDGVVLYGTDEDAAAFERAFGLFAQLVPGIGAMKSSGFGEFAAPLTLSERRSLTLSSSEVNWGDDPVVPLVLTFSDPLLVEPALASGNLQQSAEVISGSVIKAAIAEYGAMLFGSDFQREYGGLLSRLTIRAARPHETPLAGDWDGQAFSRCRTIPFSLVIVEGDDGGRFGDYFSAPPLEAELRFRCNFKSDEFDALRMDYPSRTVGRVTRTRTAIASGKWHAEDEKLFNYQMVSARYHGWQTLLVLPSDLSEAEEGKLADLVGLIQSGGIQVGKTRADMRAHWLRLVRQDDLRAAPLEEGGRRVWRMTLQTPAHILTSDRFGDLRSGSDGLRRAYIVALKECIEMIAADIGIRETGVEASEVIDAVDWSGFDFLTQHTLFGGDRAARYRQVDASYHPFLMTDAGSVFVIPERTDCSPAVSGALQRVLDDIALRGLPTIERDWRLEPFVRENGYGEVAVDWRDRAIAEAL